MCSDDVHCMDSFSWKLICDLWSKGKGLVFLLSVSITSNTETKTSDVVREPVRFDASNNTSLSFKLMEKAPDRFLRMSLSPLSLDSVAQLSISVFESMGLSVSAFSAPSLSTMMKEIETYSGGKPLYVIEFAKAVAERLQSDFPHLVKDIMTTQQSLSIDEDVSSSSSSRSSSTKGRDSVLASVKDVLQTFSSHRVEEVRKSGWSCVVFCFCMSLYELICVLFSVVIFIFFVYCSTSHNSRVRC